MPDRVIREPAILHTETISKEEFESFRKWVQEEFQKKDQRIEALEQENQKKDRKNQMQDEELRRQNVMMDFFRKELSLWRSIFLADLTHQKRLKSGSQWDGELLEEEAINILDQNGILPKGRVSRAPKKQAIVKQIKLDVEQRLRHFKKRFLVSRDMGSFLGRAMSSLTSRRWMERLDKYMPMKFKLHRKEGTKYAWKLEILNPCAVVW